MKGPGATFLVLLLVAVGALLFRLPDLGNRPFHGDEAVHAFKFEDLWKKGVYRYDPNEFHGPTLYYATLPSMAINGRTSFADTQESDYRLPVAFFGAALIALFSLLADGVGRRAVICAGILAAVSPAMVFYSRYYIQEMLLAFFTVGMIVCGWRYTRRPQAGWLALSGLCAGMMIASKETAVITFLAVAGACFATVAYTRWIDARPLPLAKLWKPTHYLVSLAVCLGSACLLLSGFFTNGGAPLDYLRSYLPWFGRAHGTDLHKHPFFYYLQLVLWSHEGKGPVWSEAVILGLAAVGIVIALLPRARSRFKGSTTIARFLAFFTLILTLIYSVIPYKTPWCLLNFWVGFLLLAGIGAVALVRMPTGRSMRICVGAAIGLGCVQLAFLAHYSSFVAFADSRNPYAYAQPVPEVQKLADRVEELSRASDAHQDMVVKVFSVDNYYWPLPWYLRRFPNVGFWTQVPQDTDAPVILASPEFDEQLTQRLDKTHLMNGYFSMRSGVLWEVWIRTDLWQKYLEHKKASAPDRETSGG